MFPMDFVVRQGERVRVGMLAPHAARLLERASPSLGPKCIGNFFSQLMANHTRYLPTKCKRVHLLLLTTYHLPLSRCTQAVRAPVYSARFFTGQIVFTDRQSTGGNEPNFTTLGKFHA